VYITSIDVDLSDEDTPSIEKIPCTVISAADALAKERKKLIGSMIM
jgi:hypothetical protein